MDRIFAKTILCAYGSLETVAGHIDDLVMRRALSSNVQSGDFALFGAQRQIEGVVRLMNKKNDLINLKVATDEALAAIDGTSRSILEDKYFRRLKLADTAARLGLSLRTCFRRLQKAEERFANACAAKGCDQKWFEENYFSQSWLKNLYFRIKEAAEKEPASQ